MRDRVLEILIRAKDSTATALGRFQRNLRGVERTVRNVGRSLLTATKYITGLGVAFAGSVIGLAKFGQQGDKAIAVGAAFTRMAGNQAEALERLRQASRGTVSDFQLMALHNQALALRAADTTEQFAEMIEVSRDLGRAQGLDALSALESLTTGLGRQSKMFLDNLGILVNVEQVYANYAESLGKTVGQLTDAEKRTAFLSAAMAQAREKAAAMAAETGAGAEAGSRLATAFENAKNRLAEFVAQSPGVAAFLDQISGLVTGISDAIVQQDWGALADLFRAIGGMLGDALVFGMKKSIESLPENTSFDRNVEGFLRFLGLDIDRIKEWWKDRFVTQRDVFDFGSFADAMAPGQAEMAAVLKRLSGGRTKGAMGPSRRVPGTDEPESIDLSGLPGLRGTGFGLALDAYDRNLLLGGGVAGRSRLHRTLGPIDMPGVSPLRGGSDASLGDVARRSGDEARAGAAAFEEAGQIVAGTMFGMAQAAIYGTENVAAAVTQMITQIVQSIPSIGGGPLGTVIGGFGGLLTAAFSRNKPMPVSISEYQPRALSQMEGVQGKRHTGTTVILGRQSLDDLEREFADRENRDESTRSRNRTVFGGRSR